MNQYFQFLFLCHRLPSRSFFYRGVQFPICARCTGICIGYVIGIILALFKVLPFFYALILIIPMIIDGSGQLFNKWLSTNYRRLVTGILGGIGIVFMFLYAALLFWNLTIYLYKKGEYIGSLIFN